MKVYSLIFCLFILNSNCLGNTNINTKQFENFLTVLAMVESSNNPKAYNKSENAIGLYQIRKLYFIDAQKINPALQKYRHEDCYRPEIAKMVVISYFQKYAQKELNNNNFEALARLHNSGPSWKNKKHLTENYWNKINKQLTRK